MYLWKNLKQLSFNHICPKQIVTEAFQMAQLAIVSLIFCKCGYVECGGIERGILLQIE